MALLQNPDYYRGGNLANHSTCIGYEGGYNRVVRFSFKTGAKGATSISITTDEGTIQRVGGEDVTSIPFYIGTSSTSHKNASEESGSAVTGHITGSDGKAYSGKATVDLKPNTTYYLWFFPKLETYGYSYWHSSGGYTTSYSISGISDTITFKLSITTDAGIKSVTVNRTSSAVGASTGNLSNGATIYKNDKLKITFTPNNNYSITTHTVNDRAFTSGNTHTVSDNVCVVAKSTPLKSLVGATDASVGSVTTITITRYNSSYTHKLEYTFGNLKGDIDINPFDTSIAWNIPFEFYGEIPTSSSGECTIICTTYNGATKIGSSSCKFTVTVNQSNPIDIQKGFLFDCNPTTFNLTGNNGIIIKYRSSVYCMIYLISKSCADILSASINGISLPINEDDIGRKYITTTLVSVETNVFTVKATDSRGLSSTKEFTLPMINYIMLTCNPVISRPAPTENILTMTFSGNFFNPKLEDCSGSNLGIFYKPTNNQGLNQFYNPDLGEFYNLGQSSECNNQLKLEYQYKDNEVGTYGAYIDGEWTEGAWSDVSNHISKGAGTYGSTEAGADAPEAFKIEGVFDYTKSYTFQIRVTDGANENILTTVIKEVEVPQGIPVFDWGKNDFNLNVPLMLKNINILDIVYPIGSVYMSVDESIPTTINDIGVWESIGSGIDNVYAWKRIEPPTE